MELRQIKEFYKIDDTFRAPGAGEDGKALVWDNVLQLFVYQTIAGSDTDIHLESAYRQAGGNNAVYELTDGTKIFLPLGALAWESSIGISVPDDKQIVFSNGTDLDGEDTLRYDYDTKDIKLTDFGAFVGKVSSLDTLEQPYLQYLGKGSVSIGTGAKKALTGSETASYNIFAGKEAGKFITDGSNNVIIGREAGSDTATDVDGSVMLGAYSGQFETSDDMFYVGSQAGSDLATSRTAALMWGDMANHELNINNNVRITETVKLGEYTGLSPEGGMIQFVDAGGGLVKPQYYDETAWVDFANGINNYLSAVLKGTADVGTTDPAYQITFERQGLGDLTLQLGANAFNSTEILTPKGVQGSIQLFDGIDDLTYSDKLFWDATNFLRVDGAVRLGEYSLGTFGTGNGMIQSDGTHVYARIDGAWRQLDNDLTAGQANTASNLGAGEGLFYQKTGVDLEFKSLTEGSKISLTGSASEVEIAVDYTVDATNSAAGTGTGLIYKDKTDTATSTVLNFKKLKAGTNVTLTNGVDDVTIDFSGTPTGETNTAAGVGTGESVFYQKNGVQLEFNNIKAADNIVVTTDGVNHDILLDVVDLVQEGDSTGLSGAAVYTGYSGTTQRTLNFRTIDGANDIDVTIDGADSNKINVGLDTALYVPVFDNFNQRTYVSGTKTLTWSFDYDENRRDGISYTDTPVASLRFGDRITYDEGTNTINALPGVGDPLVSVAATAINRSTAAPIAGSENFVVRETSDKTVVYTKDSTNIVQWTELGWLAFEDEIWAATASRRGAVKIGAGIAVTADGTISVDSTTADDTQRNEVTQVGHGFSVLDAIRTDIISGEWVKAQADDDDNSGVMGVVVEVVDTNTFVYQYGGLLRLSPNPFSFGQWYFLSPTVAGQIIAEPTYTTGQVRQYIGTGTTDGILLELALGNVIGSTLSGGGTGTVTAVTAGDGMDFTTITESGSVSLGLPSTLTSATANAVTTTSHTHSVDISGFSIKELSDVSTSLGTGEFLYWDGTRVISLNTNVVVDKTITGLGTVSSPAELVNDEDVPGASKYYGTNTSGTKGYHDLPYEVVQNLGTTSGAISFNISNGRSAVVTLDGNATITFSNLQSGDTGHISVSQDAIGSHSLTFAGGTINIAENSIDSGDTVSLTGAPSSKDVIIYWYDGTVINIAVVYNMQ